MVLLTLYLQNEPDADEWALHLKDGCPNMKFNAKNDAQYESKGDNILGEHCFLNKFGLDKRGKAYLKGTGKGQ